MYQLQLSKGFTKQFKKLDASVQQIIKRWIETHLIACENPRIYGKALIGNFKGYWRYRIGNYRLIVEVRDAELIIVAVSIAHRREVYDKNG